MKNQNHMSQGELCEESQTIPSVEHIFSKKCIGLIFFCLRDHGVLKNVSSCSENVVPFVESERVYLEQEAIHHKKAMCGSALLPDEWAKSLRLSSLRSSKTSSCRWTCLLTSSEERIWYWRPTSSTTGWKTSRWPDLSDLRNRFWEMRFTAILSHSRVLQEKGFPFIVWGTHVLCTGLGLLNDIYWCLPVFFYIFRSSTV